MFDFQKLEVYQKSKAFNKGIYFFIQKNKLTGTVRDQLHRAAFSIQLNIAEGTSRFSKKDRKNFFIISRGSVFECVAVFEYLLEIEVIDKLMFEQHYNKLEELSKMLFALIKKLDE